MCLGAEVAVSAEQTVVQTESMELKNAVDRRQIVELPLPTRNPLDLVRTMAGIVPPTGFGIADAFVHGLRGNSTNITHDGINVADNFVKTSSFFALSAPTVDAVGEFNVSVGGVGVDAGFGAAQVSIRTRRGSNDVHGSVYWFQRTNALNANNWFNNASGVARPFQLQNRIGFNVGGPAFVPKVYDGRNRSWFFWNYEAFREPVSRSRTRTVLTSPARQGQFTYARADNAARPISSTSWRGCTARSSIPDSGRCLLAGSEFRPDDSLRKHKPRRLLGRTDDTLLRSSWSERGRQPAVFRFRPAALFQSGLQRDQADCHSVDQRGIQFRNPPRVFQRLQQPELHGACRDGA